MTATRPCPECAAGKHVNCTFSVLNDDDEVEPCPCHQAGHGMENCDEPGCTETTITVINGNRTCMKHIDTVMGRAFTGVREALRELR